MCIVALAWKINPQYPVILMSNRDEFYARPTQPLYQWQNGIIAAQDLKEGGTWFGILPTGKWATITNYREKIADDPSIAYRSRGLLITDYLTGNLTPSQFAQTLQTQAQLNQYKGFSVLFGNTKTAYAMSNRGIAQLPLSNGLYVLSNGHLDEPWHKVEQLRLKANQEVLPLMQQSDFNNAHDVTKTTAWQHAFSILKNTTLPTDSQLPNTGIGIDLERQLAPIFVQSPVYGTSASTVAAISNDLISNEQINNHPIANQSNQKKIVVEQRMFDAKGNYESYLYQTS